MWPKESTLNFWADAPVFFRFWSIKIFKDFYNCVRFICISIFIYRSFRLRFLALLMMCKVEAHGPSSAEIYYHVFGKRVEEKSFLDWFDDRVDQSYDDEWWEDEEAD